MGIRLNPDGLITRVEAVYGREQGVIRAFYPPRLKGEGKHNGIVELKNGSRYELTFGMNESRLYIRGLEGIVKQYSISQLTAAIQPGDQVQIDYCPYALSRRNRRILCLRTE